MSHFALIKLIGVELNKYKPEDEMSPHNLPQIIYTQNFWQVLVNEIIYLC